MKKLTIAMLAGACLSGCAAGPTYPAPHYVEVRSGQVIDPRPSSGETALGPRIAEPGAVIEQPAGSGFGGRSIHEEPRRW